MRLRRGQPANWRRQVQWTAHWSLLLFCSFFLLSRSLVPRSPAQIMARGEHQQSHGRAAAGQDARADCASEGPPDALIMMYREPDDGDHNLAARCRASCAGGVRFAVPFADLLIDRMRDWPRPRLAR